MGRVAFPTRKADHPHTLRINGCLVNIAEHGFPVFRVSGKQTECEHAVCFPAAHTLAENEHSLVALTGEAAEATG